METPPVYRIEVLGTVGGQMSTCFAHEDVLTSAGSTVTANFRDLPVEYFAETVTNRRVRAWYAGVRSGPGLSPMARPGRAATPSVTLRTYSASGEQQPDQHDLQPCPRLIRRILPITSHLPRCNITPLAAPELQ